MPRPSYERREIVELIRRWERQFGHAPTIAEWLAWRERGADTWPGPTVVVRLFGSWSAALAAAGFDPHPPSVVTRPAPILYARLASESERAER